MGSAAQEHQGQTPAHPTKMALENSLRQDFGRRLGFLTSVQEANVNLVFLLFPQEMIPFAVVGSDQEYQVNGRRILGRKTKWGTIEGTLSFFAPVMSPRPCPDRR